MKCLYFFRNLMSRHDVLLIIAALIFLALALVFYRHPSGQSEAIKCGSKLEDFEVMAWVPYWDQENAFRSFERNSQYIDYLGFFWYKLDEDGSVKKYDNTKEDIAMLRNAQKKGVKVFATIVNLPEYYETETDWDHKRVRKAIENENARKKHIREIVSIVESNGFDGANIGYEMMKADQKEMFSLFVSELADALHRKNKMLGVSILPKTSEDDPKEDNGSHAQDLRLISSKADHLYFELYGEHYPQSSPGPVASARWVKDILAYAINDAKASKSKIFAGVPLYAEAWEILPSGKATGLKEELNIKDAEKIRMDSGAVQKWNELEKSVNFSYRKNGRSYIVWTENEKSICKKLELFERHGIGKVALWRLGGEKDDFWETFVFQK